MGKWPVFKPSVKTVENSMGTILISYINYMLLFTNSIQSTFILTLRFWHQHKGWKQYYMHTQDGGNFFEFAQLSPQGKHTYTYSDFYI